MAKTLVLISDNFDLQDLEELDLTSIIFMGPHISDNVIYCESHNLEERAFLYCQSHHITEVITLNETLVLLSAFLNTFYKINGIKYNEAVYFRNKNKMKTLVSLANIRHPTYKKISCVLEGVVFAETHGYPVVIKPLQEAGSMKVQKINNRGEWSNVSFNRFWSDKFLVEEFIYGDMYEVDGFIKDGELLLAIPCFLINTPLNHSQGAWVGAGVVCPESSIYADLMKFTNDVIKAMPKVTSFFHLEVFHQKDSNQLLFCEIACRPPAIVIPQLWKEVFGVNMITLALKLKTSPEINNLPALFKQKKISYVVVFPGKCGKLASVPKQEDFPHCQFQYFIPLNHQVKATSRGAALAMQVTITVDRSINNEELDTLLSQIEAKILWE